MIILVLFFTVAIWFGIVVVDVRLFNLGTRTSFSGLVAWVDFYC